MFSQTFGLELFESVTNWQAFLETHSGAAEWPIDAKKTSRVQSRCLDQGVAVALGIEEDSAWKPRRSCA